MLFVPMYYFKNIINKFHSNSVYNFAYKSLHNENPTPSNNNAKVISKIISSK